MGNSVTDNCKDVMIVCLTLILVYLVYKKLNKSRKTQSKSCSNKDVELLNINSNTVNHDIGVTNMSGNELSRIDDNKPYVSYDFEPLNNESIHDIMQNVEQPDNESTSFHYTKDYDNVRYYDGHVVYPSV